MKRRMMSIEKDDEHKEVWWAEGSMMSIEKDDEQRERWWAERWTFVE